MSDHGQIGIEAGEQGAEGRRSTGDPAASPQSGILSQLPRTRPQRASQRRVRIERPAASTPPAAKAGAPAAKARGPAADAGARARSRQRQKPRKPRANASERAIAGTAATPEPPRSSQRERVPRQGFEPEEQLGRDPVSPPSGLELVQSLIELTDELVRAGVSSISSLSGLAKQALQRRPRL